MPELEPGWQDLDGAQQTLDGDCVAFNRERKRLQEERLDFERDRTKWGLGRLEYVLDEQKLRMTSTAGVWSIGDVSRMPKVGARIS